MRLISVRFVFVPWFGSIDKNKGIDMEMQVNMLNDGLWDKQAEDVVTLTNV